jgi:hypothetical protein
LAAQKSVKKKGEVFTRQWPFWWSARTRLVDDPESSREKGGIQEQNKLKVQGKKGEYRNKTRVR